MMTINYRFVVDRSNWASVTQQCGKFCGSILVQELKPNDLLQHKIFGEWALEKVAENTLLYRKIAHFWLNGYVNKQNDFGVKII